MVPQVQVVAILMIVNGALSSLLGLLLAAMGPFLFAVMSMDKGAPQQPQDKAVLGVLSGVYLVLGLLVLVAGVLNIVAGIRCLRFRGRIFAIVALFFNVLPVFTFYCAPTSLGVLIYGIIVLFNAEVVQAFALADQGVPADEIRRRFGGRRRVRRWDYEEEDE
jgi:hypothetical protein